MTESTQGGCYILDMDARNVWRIFVDKFAGRQSLEHWRRWNYHMNVGSRNIDKLCGIQFDGSEDDVSKIRFDTFDCRNENFDN